MWASIREEQQAAHDQREGRWLPVLDLARFLAAYPGLDPFHGWPETPDGAIPCRLFFTLYRAIPHVTAGRKLDDAQAMGAAITGTIGGEKGPARDLLKQAYPEIDRGH